MISVGFIVIAVKVTVLDVGIIVKTVGVMVIDV